MCIKIMYNNHIYLRVYFSINQQSSTVQNCNYFCTNRIQCCLEAETGVCRSIRGGRNGKLFFKEYCVLCLVTHSFATLWTVACQAPLSMGILQARTLDWVAISFSRGSSQPRSPTLQKDSLPAEPARKPKNTGVGSLSLLKGNFLT